MTALRASATCLTFYDSPETLREGTARTWIGRGANFVIAYSAVEAGSVLRRDNHDEYIVFSYDAPLSVTAGPQSRDVPPMTLVVVPPGASEVAARSGGHVVRVFSCLAQDLAAQASNAAAYAAPVADVAPLTPWPDPVGGFVLRTYFLDDYPVIPGVLGRIFRTTNLMVNVFRPDPGPRDPEKLTPHVHDDFEQASLALIGDFEHHIRYPWTSRRSEWRDDEHFACSSPSVMVIPAGTLHTSQGVAPGTNWLMDVFGPPRRDFSERPGWVRNAEDYPAPESVLGATA
jgi:hypothetical protein